MKWILSCLSVLLIVCSCNSNKAGSPKTTVQSFINASKEGNLAEVKKYITKSDLGLLEMGEGFLSKFDPNAAKEMQEKMSNEFKAKTKDATIEIKDETIDGDNATVNVAFNYEGKSETRPFSLKKEEGVWKVSLISTGMKNAGKNGEDIQEAMKQMNVDSLKTSIQMGMDEINKMDKDSLKKVMEQAMKEMDKLKENNQ